MAQGGPGAAQVHTASLIVETSSHETGLEY